MCSVMRVMATQRRVRSVADRRHQGRRVGVGPEGAAGGGSWVPPGHLVMRRWATAMATTSTSPYSTRFKIVAVAVLALAIAAFVGAYLATSDEGDDELGASGDAAAGEMVEQRIPAPNSQVPQQSTIGIDLARSEPPPGGGQLGEGRRGGRTGAPAVVGPTAEGRAPPRQVPWCFEVV